MVPLNGLSFEEESNDNREDGKRQHLLDYFQLHQVEGTAVAHKTNSVGRYGETVLKKGNAPGKEDDKDERPARGNLHFLQLEMAVPGECHENIRKNQHDYGPETLHSLLVYLVLGRKNSNFA